MSIIQINNITYNTNNYEDRKNIGLSQEIIFHNFLKENEIIYKHISEEMPYNSFDFIKIDEKTRKIVELKTRLKNISYHNVAYIDYNKIENYKRILKQYPNTKFYFVFNHLNLEDATNEFYIYEVDFKELPKISFIINIFDKKTFELPIKHLIPLKDNLNLLK